MDLDVEDLVLYVYVIAVVITGIYLERTLGGLDRFVVLAFGGLAAVFWAIYFRRAIEPRLVPSGEGDRSPPED